VCVEYGTGPGGLPYHRFGSGEQPLVVVPGVLLEELQEAVCE